MTDEERGGGDSPKATIDQSIVRDAVRRFDAAASRGERPDLEKYLVSVPEALKDETFERLLRTLLAHADRTGETFALGDLRRRHPERSGAIERVLSERSETSSLDTSSFARDDQATVDRQEAAPESSDSRQGSSPPSARGESRPPKRFGDYELIGEIARGGMGVVYRARQIKLNRIVAIKMILSGQLASEDDVRRFYSEAEAAAGLDHPGIVPIYEVGETDGQHYFSMGFVEGESLQDAVRSGPLPQREAAELTRRIAEAIEFAHRRGIVHRDLKPRNILLAADGRPKVTDFGLAKRVDKEGDLTLSGQILGTPAYMPPEQAAGKISAIGPRSDIYSLGGVLYCLLTGRPPFQSATLTETLKQVLESPPASPRLLNPSVDRDLETICLKCLEKDPRHRYASAAEVGDELARYLAGDPIRARRLGPISRGWRWVRRRPLAAALVASAVAFVALAAVFADFGYRTVQAYRVDELVRTADATIADVDLTPAYFERTDAAIREISASDPEAATPLPPRANQSFAATVRAELRQATFDRERADRVAAAIETLRPRDAELASALDKEFARRRSEWQTDFRLAAPFDGATTRFPIDRTTIATGPDQAPLLSRADRGQENATLPMTATSDGAVELHVTFGPTWESARLIGVRLNANDEVGYAFTLEAAPNELDESSSPTSPEKISFARTREADGSFVATIRRNDVALARRTLHSRDVPTGPLTLIATRERGIVRMQANDLPTIEFADPFPLPARGSFAIDWPAGVGIEELVVRRKAMPPASSPLERGDELFEAGDYELALEQFDRQALETDDVAVRQECRFKRGVCLDELGRADDAAATFEELMPEEGDRWPPLAGARLWLIRLRQNRVEEANGTFDYLSSRFRFDEFAPLIPAELRDAIQATYGPALVDAVGAMRFDADRIENVERISAVDRFFSEDGRGNPHIQIHVARAYAMHGDLPAAVEVARRVAKDSRDSTVFRHYVRFLRLGENASAARRELANFELRNPGLRQDAMFAIERARIHAALGDWHACEAEIDEIYRRERVERRTSAMHMTYAALIKAELLEQRGAEAPAAAVRAEAFRQGMAALDANSRTGTEQLQLLILGSVSGEIDDEQCRRLFAALLHGGGESAIVRQAQAMIEPTILARSLREMWRSPLGRRYARAFAFETIHLGDRIKAPVALVATSYVNQATMRGEMSPAQEEAVFEAFSIAFDAAILRGELQMGQLVQLVLTWKGQSGFIGWGAVAPTLEPEIRAGMAYGFALRYVALGKHEQAFEFLRTAERDAPPGSKVASVATADREALEAKRGFLAIESDAGIPLRLKATPADGGQETPIEVEVEDGAEVALPAGAWTLELVSAPSDCSLETLRATASLLARTPVTIRRTWAPAKTGETLSGLLPLPAPEALDRRWQLHFRDPARIALDVAWSGDGSRFAVASADEKIRVYDATTLELIRILESPHALSALRWAPSAERILATGETTPFSIWDASTGKSIARRSERYWANVIAWRADATQFATANNDSQSTSRIWDADGGLLKEFQDNAGGAQAVALSPDGGTLVTRRWVNGGVMRRWNVDEGSWQEFAGPDQGEYKQACFSPDGKWFVAGAGSKSIPVWETTNWTCVAVLSHQDRWLDDLEWSVDSGRLYAWLDHHGVAVFDMRSQPPALARTIDLADLECGAICPDESRFLYADTGGELHVVGTGDVAVKDFGARRREIFSLSARPTDGRIAAGSVWRQMKFFDGEGRPIGSSTLSAPGDFRALVWSPDGTKLAGLTSWRHLRILSPDGSILVQPDAEVRNEARLLAWTHDGSAILAVKEAGGSLVRFDATTGVSTKVEGIEANPVAIACASNGRLATMRVDWTVGLFDPSGAETAVLPGLDGGHPQFIEWSPNGDLILVVRYQSQNGLYRPDGEVVWQLPAGEFMPTDAAWSPDGAKVAIGYDDGSLRVLAAETGEFVRDFAASGAYERVSVAWLDENRLAWAGEEGTLRIVDLGDSTRFVTTLTLPDDGWARFTAAGELLDESGDAEGSLLYGVENPDGSLETIPPSEFRRRVAERNPAASSSNASPEADPPVIPIPPEELQPTIAEIAELATIAEPRIDESSGLARCSFRADAVWTHDDSGDPALFLIGFDGATISRLSLPDATCDDWEDATSLRRGEANFLLVGDVGDNLRQREHVELFLVREPSAEAVVESEIVGAVAERYRIRYEDGPHDCEAIAIDPATGKLLLLTKEIDRECSLFEADLVPFAEGAEPTVARRVAGRDIPAPTAMDVSPDGRRLAVLTTTHVWEWDLSADGDRVADLAGKPRLYPIAAEGQFEGVAYSLDGRSLLFTSEGERRPLRAMKVDAAP